jgi:hypothetical protein
MSLAVLDSECFDGFEVFDLHFLKGEELHDVLFLAWVQGAGDLAAFWDKRITHRCRAIQLDVDLSFVMIFHHVLDYVALAFQVLYFGHFCVFGQQFEFLTQRWVDNLAVGPIVELSADIVLDQDVDFGVWVDGQGKQSFFEVVILSISPVEFVLLPHFPETVQADTFTVVCVLFEHFVEDVLVKNLAA